MQAQSCCFSSSVITICQVCRLLWGVQRTQKFEGRLGMMWLREKLISWKEAYTIASTLSLPLKLVEIVKSNTYFLRFERLLISNFVCGFEDHMRHGYQEGRKGPSNRDRNTLHFCSEVGPQPQRKPREPRGDHSFLVRHCVLGTRLSSSVNTVPTSGVDTCLFHIQGCFEFLQVDLPVLSSNGLKLLCHPLKPLSILLGTHDTETKETGL